VPCFCLGGSIPQRGVSRRRSSLSCCVVCVVVRVSSWTCFFVQETRTLHVICTPMGALSYVWTIGPHPNALYETEHRKGRTPSCSVEYVVPCSPRQEPRPVRPSHPSTATPRPCHRLLLRHHPHHPHYCCPCCGCGCRQQQHHESGVSQVRGRDTTTAARPQRPRGGMMAPASDECETAAPQAQASRTHSNNPLRHTRDDATQDA